MGFGSVMSFGASVAAPAIPAERWRNWRRDQSFFMESSLRKLTADSLQLAEKELRSNVSSWA
jgi:hypothetical protein